MSFRAAVNSTIRTCFAPVALSCLAAATSTWNASIASAAEGKEPKPLPIGESADPALKLTVSPMFADHMVLQRDMRVPIWGTAAPGAPVLVSVMKQEDVHEPGEPAATAEATADAAGKWQTKIGPIAAGGPYSMTVSAGRTARKLADVLFGDVWLAGGQSNMEWGVGGVVNAKEEMAAANFPEIRAINIPKRTAEETQESFDGKGWDVCSPKSVGWFPAVGYFFARDIYKDQHVPIGIINCNWGGTPMEAWTSREALDSVPTFADDHDKAVEEANKKEVGPWGPKMPPQNIPYALYNGMLAPIIPYAIKGVVWYQGESNAGRANEYRELSELMIGDWRKRWSEGDFPFLYVQIAGWGQGGEGWVLLRDAQTKCLEIPHTGMAVPPGDNLDLHPKNKQEVGRRLALVGRKVAYGEDIECYGPMYRDFKVEGDKFRVSFDHLGGGLEVHGDKLKGFEIAGADGKFVPADATIDGEQVVLASPKVAAPTSARYYWAPYSDGNLFSKATLPAIQFTTAR